ncbi:MAG: hydrogenase expression/formation protein HypE, partial [Nostoc sp.]
MNISPTNSIQNPLFQKMEQVRRRQGKVRDTHITLAHGSGGKAMRDLIDDIFVSNFDNPILSQLEDQASFNLLPLLQQGDRLAFTTDSYV